MTSKGDLPGHQAQRRADNHMKYVPVPRFLSRLAFTSLFLILSVQCTRRTKSEIIWDQNLPQIGSQSSPRATDLNRDGVLDIVIGAGKNEDQHSRQGILALDGKSGSILWQQEADDQVYGSPTFYDVTGDGIDDIFIGGRSPNFIALDGSTGRILWKYVYQYERDPVLRHARFNFNNSVLIPDQNNDEHPDVLVVNGGNSKAAPYSMEARFPGVMMLFDSKTGNILAADTMPDGRESYMPALCYASQTGDDYSIIFGTGGETISGNLYSVSLRDFLQGKLSNATILAAEQGHGFIAPPTIADITQDGHADIVAISHGSTVFAIDGRTQKLIWKRNIPGTESSNSIAPGYFTDDGVPDIFTFVSKGQWPNNTGTLQIMLDGRNGDIVYMDSIGCTGFSSPVIYDIDNDGLDEAIISVNEFDCSLGFAGESPRDIENRLIAIDFQDRKVDIIDSQKKFKNIFTTPWIGDIDRDGYLDIVHCQYFHNSYLLSFLGMRVRRIATPIKIRGEVVWGSYMGSHGNGVFLTGE